MIQNAELHLVVHFESLSCAFGSASNARKLQFTSAVQFLCNSTLQRCQTAAAIAGQRLMNRAFVCFAAVGHDG